MVSMNKCPALINLLFFTASLNRYFLSNVETNKMVAQQKYEEHKRRSRHNRRKREVIK